MNYSKPIDIVDLRKGILIGVETYITMSQDIALKYIFPNELSIVDIEETLLIAIKNIEQKYINTWYLRVRISELRRRLLNIQSRATV